MGVETTSAAAGLEHPCQLAQQRVGVRGVFDDLGADHAIEVAGGQRGERAVDGRLHAVCRKRRGGELDGQRVRIEPVQIVVPAAGSPVQRAEQRPVSAPVVEDAVAVSQGRPSMTRR